MSYSGRSRGRGVFRGKDNIDKQIIHESMKLETKAVTDQNNVQLETKKNSCTAQNDSVQNTSVDKIDENLQFEDVEDENVNLKTPNSAVKIEKDYLVSNQNQPSQAIQIQNRIIKPLVVGCNNPNDCKECLYMKYVALEKQYAILQQKYANLKHHCATMQQNCATMQPLCFSPIKKPFLQPTSLVYMNNTLSHQQHYQHNYQQQYQHQLPQQQYQHLYQQQHQHQAQQFVICQHGQSNTNYQSLLHSQLFSKSYQNK